MQHFGVFVSVLHTSAETPSVFKFHHLTWGDCCHKHTTYLPWHEGTLGRSRCRSGTGCSSRIQSELKARDHQSFMKNAWLTFLTLQHPPDKQKRYRGGIFSCLKEVIWVLQRKRRLFVSVLITENPRARVWADSTVAGYKNKEGESFGEKNLQFRLSCRPAVLTHFEISHGRHLQSGQGISFGAVVSSKMFPPPIQPPHKHGWILANQTFLISKRFPLMKPTREKWGCLWATRLQGHMIISRQLKLTVKINWVKSVMVWNNR